ncbi:MAG: hypothetical protein HY903_05400, partial [Deltaproteobacteria bacterium]|nr:hypothetical protein [Deltaproteobacteria bacterium]
MAIAAAVGFAGVGLFAPRNVHAWPTNGSAPDCGSCHATDATGVATNPGSILVAIDGVDKTSSPSVTVAPSASIQIDWRYLSVAGRLGSGEKTTGAEIVLGTTWTANGGSAPGNGTANSPALTGWSTVWDGNHAQQPAWTGPNAVNSLGMVGNGYTKNYNGTTWDQGARNSAFDDASAGDLDLGSNSMGVDALLTAPSAAGTYSLWVLGVGHERTSGGRAYVAKALTITVVAGDTTTVGTGTEPGSGSVGPGGAATMLDAFTLQTSTGTDTVTAATVTLAAGTYAGVGLVEITN